MALWSMCTTANNNWTLTFSAPSPHPWPLDKDNTASMEGEERLPPRFWHGWFYFCSWLVWNVISLFASPPTPLQQVARGVGQRDRQRFQTVLLANQGNIVYKVAWEKQPTFGNANTGFPAKWHLRNERRNSILMTCHYTDLSSASDWSCHEGNLIQPIRSTTQIWVVTRHQYAISALVSQMSLAEKPVVALPNVTSFFWLFKRLKTVAMSL